MTPQKTNFYVEDLSTPCLNPNLEDHPLSAVRDCIFSILVATLYTESRSSIRNLRTRHAVVTGTDLSQLTGMITAHYFFKLKIIRTENMSNKNKSPAKLSWLQTQRLLSL